MLRRFLSTRWFACRVLSCIVLGLTAASVHAQTSFPAKPVRLIVTFTTGGAADITGRILAEKLTEIWKQQVIVENRVGAGGNIGIEAVHKAPADGHTLLVISNSHAVNVGLYDKLPYDLIADFAPITLIANASLALVAHPKLPANTLPELVRLFRDNPGKYTYASCGNGTAHHLAMELFKFQTKTFVVHVPYRGCSPGTVDAVGGQVDMILVTLGTALPHIKAGRLKAMALTNSIRTPAAPEIQTMHEAGVPELANYEVDNWYALAAPAGTPAEVIAKIGADSRRVLALPDVRQRMAGAGLDAVSSTPEEQLNSLKADIAKFKRVIEFAGIKPG
jgi:tripartite-type tricarboxylate transporter receptor subunit TctC